ncbi:MAG: hypothetical protein CL489_18005 [Acidobacteria bacterium]|nr:hypothetical protein [Acidobacteriota bacterium]
MTSQEESRVFEDLVKEGNILVFNNDWKLVTVPRDEYNKQRWLKHNGERIYAEFKNGDKVQETFDPRIFNCYYYLEGEEIIVTTRAESSNDLCKCIVMNDFGTFRDMLLQEHFKGKEKEYMVKYFKQDMDKETAERVQVIQIPKKDKHGYDITVCYYIVDGIFMIDDKGTSYMLNTEYEDKKKKGSLDDCNRPANQVYTHEGTNDAYKQVDKKRWEFLCTVMKEDWGDQKVETELGVVTVNKTMQTIMAKIRYLMSPREDDYTTLDQIKRYPKLYRFVMDGINHGR